MSKVHYLWITHEIDLLSNQKFALLPKMAKKCDAALTNLKSKGSSCGAGDE